VDATSYLATKGIHVDTVCVCDVLRDAEIDLLHPSFVDA